MRLTMLEETGPKRVAIEGHGQSRCWISIRYRYVHFSISRHYLQFPDGLSIKVKVRFQSPAIARKYHSTFHAITTIIREERFIGLYKGITSPLVIQGFSVMFRPNFI